MTDRERRSGSNRDRGSAGNDDPRPGVPVVRALTMVVVGCVVLAMAVVPLGSGAIGAAGTTAVDGEPVELAVEAPDDPVPPGESVTVTVAVNATRPVYATDATLRFDADALDAVDVSAGGYLSQGIDRTIDVNASADSEAGRVRFARSRTGPDGIDGNGTLFAVTFEVDENASAPTAVDLDLSRALVLDSSNDELSVATRADTVEVGDASTPTPTPTQSSGGDGGGGGGQVGQSPDGEVEVVDRAVLNDSVLAGEPVVARVDLANYDPARGTITLGLGANGSTVAERTVAVDASTERTVLLRGELDDPGTYALGINGESAGTVTVEPETTPTPTATATATPTRTPPSTDTPTEAATPTAAPTTTATPDAVTATPTSGDGPGFGAVAALIGVLLGAGLARAAERGRR